MIEQYAELKQALGEVFDERAAPYFDALELELVGLRGRIIRLEDIILVLVRNLADTSPAGPTNE